MAISKIPGAGLDTGSGGVGISNLSATGTPSSANFLRGDNIWSGVAPSNLTTGGPSWDSSGNLTVSGTLTTASRAISKASVPTGSVLQVTWTNWAGSYVAASNTNVDFTGFSATFTPLYASSKVLIIVSAGVNFICDGIVYIKRNGSIIKDNWFGSSRQDDQYDYPQATQTYLDSPNTTSTVTYQMGGRAGGCGFTIRFGASDNSSSILFMEIAA